MAHTKPILVDTRRLGPVVDKRLYDSDCAHCGKARARWVFQPEDQEGSLLMCSICWLYDSNWGKTRRDDIDSLVADTEFELKRTFTRDGLGKLTMSGDGDRILGAICYLSKMQQMADKVRGPFDA